MSFSLDKLCGGAFAEKVKATLDDVARNIMDPNTDPEVKRKVTIVLTLAPDENRDMIKTTIVSKATLAPAAAITTNIVMGKDLQTGKVAYEEYDNQIRGQMSLEVEEEADTPVAGRDFDPVTGEIYRSSGDVIDLRKKA